MLQPMLASLADAPLTNPHLVYEPKYDGIRAIVEIPPGGVGIRLWSRLGNEKTSQFPEIVTALAEWARRRREPVVLDGEIVALDANGRPTGFQNLQGRIHLKERHSHVTSHPSVSESRRSPAGAKADRSSVALIAFDILREGRTDVRDRPLIERRQVLERIFGNTRSSILRLSEQVHGDGRALYERAKSSGWEGLIAKRADSRYLSGKRTPDWCKLKIVQEQEFVIGGWTEPRNTRAYFGALLLGVFQPSAGEARRLVHRSISGGGSAKGAKADRPSSPLIYVGHVGTGFDARELERLMKLLKPLETLDCPFAQIPPSNERPHWVEPQLVAQVRFTEWTADGILRHPVYLGLRDDKKPESVVRETKVRTKPDATPVRLKADITPAASTNSSVVSGFSQTKKAPSHAVSGVSRTKLIDQLRAIEASRRDGMLELPDGDHLKVSNLHKIFWPKQKFTKGDLFRYYAAVAPAILPAIADRPLVMKRFPNGITGAPFYQHRAEDVPDGVRVETVTAAERRSHIIGGTLKTLMYTTQLAAISQDPWFSRVQSVTAADYAALDLDPPDGAKFGKVLDVARWIHDELERLGAPGFPKTSGSKGLHIYIPLPPGTPYEAGLLLAQIIATVVAQKHPKGATIERSVNARGSRVYVDYMQNGLGKTLASAYSARASDYAGASTPLTWKEIEKGVRREDFTIETVPERLQRVGDLWSGLAKAKGVDFSRVARYTKP